MYSERSSRMKLLFKTAKSRNRSISDGDTYSNGISCVFSTVSRLVAGIRIPMSIPCVFRVCISADTVSLSKILLVLEILVSRAYWVCSGDTYMSNYILGNTYRNTNRIHFRYVRDTVSVATDQTDFIIYIPDTTRIRFEYKTIRYRV